MKAVQKYLGFLAIPILLIVAALLALVCENTLLELSPFWRFLFALVVSVVPGLLWLWFFYLEDKYEKEPKTYLIGIFILGGLLAFGISMPLESAFGVYSLNVGASEFVKFLAAFFLIGGIQEFTKYVGVRYTVYYSDEFNEPADGIIYMAASGLGFAAVYNFVYCISLQTIAVSVMSIRVVEQYLISAVFAGVTGYFMGHSKFRQKQKEITMVLGFICAAFLNGTYRYLKDVIQGLQFEAWKNLVLSGVMVIFVYGILYVLLQRALDESKFKKEIVGE
jgi:RsiW-degrading membrane proteinase PrsW (M82 family)